MKIDKILEIEKKYNLYQDKIDGINYWIYSRFEILQFYLPKLIDPAIGRTHNPPPKDYRFILSILKMLKNCIINYRKKVVASDICIINHERRICIDNTYQCMYTQEINNAFPDISIMLERPYDFQHLAPTPNKNIVYTDFISVKSNLTYFFHKCFNTKYYKNIKHQVQLHIQAPIHEINTELKINCNKEYLYELITKNIIRNQTRIQESQALLTAIKPKLIIEVVGYSNGCMAINEVAHKMGIPTIELQHGVIDEEHAGYNYKNTSPILQFPFMLWTFGEFWNKNARYPISANQIKAVGFPYFEKQVSKYADKNKTPNTILFISQGSIGMQLSQLACQLTTQYNQNTKYQILYKLHPGEFASWKSLYPELAMLHEQGSLKVIDNSNESIYQLFSTASIQIGVGSTALFEGLAFNLKTFILNTHGHERMQCLYDSGHAKLINNIEDLADALSSNDSSFSNLNINYFWKQNALETIKENIISIL